MPALRWLIAQAQNVIGIVVCIILAIIATVLDDLVDIWDEVMDDPKKILVCAAVAVLIFVIGWHELAEGQSTAGYFHMTLALVPGAPGLRYLLSAWGEGAKRTMEWH